MIIKRSFKPENNGGSNDGKMPGSSRPTQKEMIKSLTTKDKIAFKLEAHCRCFVAKVAPQSMYWDIQRPLLLPDNGVTNEELGRIHISCNLRKHGRSKTWTMAFTKDKSSCVLRSVNTLFATKRSSHPSNNMDNNDHQSPSSIFIHYQHTRQYTSNRLNIRHGRNINSSGKTCHSPTYYI